MSSSTLILDRSTQLHQNIMFLSNKNINNLYKPLILTSFFLFLFYTLLSNRHIDQSPQFLSKLSQTPYPNHHTHTSNNTHSPTNISHIVIAIAGSTDAWKFRRPYLESWWQPNVTKGYIYLDFEPRKFLPWPTSTPPYRVSESTLRYKPYDRHPTKCAIRLFRVIAETFKETQDQDIRWYVMTDDDTILFVENLVGVLQKYDHTKYFYIGESSESTLSNFENTYEMAFGGGGYAISYPLAEALAKNVDTCIKRYPESYGSDLLMQSCVADMGVPLTHEKGFHQKGSYHHTHKLHLCRSTTSTWWSQSSHTCNVWMH
ncbi:Beta-1 3-glucosyltransferase [Bienertia sinuspersici]